MTKVFALLALALSLAAISPVIAEEHKHTHTAPNGGQIQKIGAYEAELVVKGAEVSLYITDENDKKIDAAKFSAAAIALTKSNEQKTIQFKYVSDNKLVATTDFPYPDKFRATVTLRLDGKDLGKGRYAVDMPR